MIDKGKNRMKTRSGKKGFTLVELLMVIVVMALVATLATSAASKSIKQGRQKRIDTTAKSLQMALVNYRAQEGRWPVGLDPDARKDTVTFSGERNKEVFEKLITARIYLEPSGLLTIANGKRMSLREAMDRGNFNVPIGYPNPQNQSEFKYFTVVFNLTTDSVSVSP